MKKRIVFTCLAIFLLSGLRAEEKAAGTGAREETKPAPKAWRAFIEMGLNLGISTVNYWKNYKDFLEDWQFTLTWKDQTRKLFSSEGLRLDSNKFRTNWTHAWSGALYYNWARSNRLSPFVSFLFASGGSLLWEYVAEWREIASINDQIYTWAGGPTIGEPLFQIADHFRSRPGFANRIACFLVDPLLAINDFLDGESRGPRRPTPDWNDFRVSLGGKQGPVSALDNASSHLALDIDLRLVTLPGYGRPGSGSGYSSRPIDNGYRIAVSFSARQVEEWFAFTRCVLSGWWWKNVRADADGTLRGGESWLGWVTAWDFFQKNPVAPYDGDDLGVKDAWLERERPTRFSDKYSSIHLIGPAFNWTGYGRGVRARVDLEGTFDFSMVNALAYNDYSAGHDTEWVKNTLHNWGYYYSLGYRLGARFDLQAGRVRAEAAISYQRFRSIQGLDRFQDQLSDDSPLNDSRLDYGAGLSMTIPRTPLSLSLKLEGIDRRGSFHEVTVRNRELRFFYRLGVNF